MAIVERYINNGVTAVSSPYVAGSHTLEVDDASVLPPLTGGQQFHIVVFTETSPINAEIMLVTGVSGNTLTVVPAREPIKGVQVEFDHPVGDVVANDLTAESLLQIIQDNASGGGSGSDPNYGDIQNVPEGTILGRVDTGAGVAEALTPEQVVDLLMTELALEFAPLSHTHSTSEITGLDAALAGKASLSHTHPQSDITNLVSDLALKAPLDSPALIGNPTAPTQTSSDDSTKLATTGFVHSLITGLINGAPSTFDTLKEIADEIAADDTAFAALVTVVGTKLVKSANLSDLTNAAVARTNLGVPAGSGTSTGTNTGDQDLSGYSLVGHTHPQSDITNLISDLALKAPLTSPAFTGTATFVSGWQIPATVTNRAPFGVNYGSQTFNGVQDPALAVGYNLTAVGTKILANEPSLALVIDADYYDGSAHIMGYSWQYLSADGSVLRRLMSMQINKTTDTVVGGTICSPLSVFSSDGATQQFKFSSVGLEMFTSVGLAAATNDVYCLSQRNAANSTYIGLIKLNSSDQVVLGASNIVVLTSGLLFPSAETSDIGATAANRPRTLNLASSINVASPSVTAGAVNVSGSSTTERTALYLENRGTQTVGQLTSILFANSGVPAASGGHAKISLIVESATGGARRSGLSVYTSKQVGGAGLVKCWEWDGDGTANTGFQIVSTVATGTAPFSVASTTKVTNLNADLLDGLDSTAFAAASHTHPQSDITNLASDLAAKAPLASPTLTGTPLAPTAAIDTNTTQIATTAFVLGQASASGDGTPAMDGTAARGTSNHYARADHVHPTDTSRAAASHTHAQSDITNLVSDLALKAPLASPALTGNPTAPTQTSTDNSTKVATTAFVTTAITNLINMAPAALDTLGEIATQLAADESALASLTTTVGTKLAKASNLSDLANVATAVGNLGLTIGTNTQAWDADLDAIAALVSAADTFPYFTGSHTAALATLTSQARDLLDDTSFSAMRTTLGLGTLATQSGTFSGTSSGTNTGDQTITLTGDVTGSGTGSFSATIGAGVVTLAKMADVATGTVFYRKSASTGAPEVQTLATLKSDLGLSGTNTGDQTSVTGNAGTATALQTARNISMSGDVVWTVSFDGTGNVTAAGTIQNDAVTYAKMQNVSTTDKVLGRSTAGSGDVEEITCTSAGRALLAGVDAAAQRTTLSLGDAATKNVGTTSGTVAAGDDNRLVPPSVCEHRLTLTSGTHTTTSNVSSASTVYLSPCIGKRLNLYDGSAWKIYLLPEIAITLSSLTSDKNYDVFAFASTATPSSTNTTTDVLTFGSATGWNTGAWITIATSVGGVTAGTDYWYRAVSSTTGTLHTSLAGALANTGKVDLTASVTNALTAVSLELSTAWTNDTTRADAITTQDQVDVKNGSTTRRLLGTFYTTSTTTTEDSDSSRYVCNLYNKRPRPMKATYPGPVGGIWDQTVVGPRSVNSVTTVGQTRLQYTSCKGDDPVAVRVVANSYSTTATNIGCEVGIGIDSTSTISSSGGAGKAPVGTFVSGNTAIYEGYPGLGRHFLQALESATGTSGVSWIASNAGAVWDHATHATVWG